MENQQHDEIWADLRNQEGSVKFEDPCFPPVNKSLCPPQDWKDDPYGEYEWVRATKIPELTDEEGDLQIFNGNVEPNDIKQGALGDCYFLSSLSVIAENPDRIKKMFPVDEINEEGIYAVDMTKNGRPVHIVLDDFVPCKDHRPCFSSANGNELWVLLLEKAWAKLHGSYDRIISGQAHETMRDLTGAPAFEYIIADHAEDIFDKIK